jgi:hypothetical protein
MWILPHGEGIVANLSGPSLTARVHVFAVVGGTESMSPVDIEAPPARKNPLTGTSKEHRWGATYPTQIKILFTR